MEPAQESGGLKWINKKRTIIRLVHNWTPATWTLTISWATKSNNWELFAPMVKAVESGIPRMPYILYSWSISLSREKRIFIRCNEKHNSSILWINISHLNQYELQLTVVKFLYMCDMLWKRILSNTDCPFSIIISKVLVANFFNASTFKCRQHSKLKLCWRKIVQ